MEKSFSYIIKDLATAGFASFSTFLLVHFVKTKKKNKKIIRKSKNETIFQENSIEDLELKRALNSYTPMPLDTYSTVNWFREFRHDHSIIIDKRAPGILITKEGMELKDFCSNDFLGLSMNKQILDRINKFIKYYGVGSCGPRGFYGSTDAHYKLESDVSSFYDQRGLLFAVLFPTFSCTLMSLVNLVKKEDIIIFDAENASEAIIRAVHRHKGQSISVSLPKWKKESKLLNTDIINGSTRSEEKILITSNEQSPNSNQDNDDYISINDKNILKQDEPTTTSIDTYSTNKFNEPINIALPHKDSLADKEKSYCEKQLGDKKMKVDPFETKPQQSFERYIDEKLAAEKLNAHNKQNSLKESKAKNNVWLFFDSINEFTGELYDIPKIVKLCEKGYIRSILNDSLGFGTLGSHGRGAVEFFSDIGYDINVAHVDVYVTSLENSAASLGGIVLGSRLLVEHQRNIGVGYVFSAATPPALCESSRLSLRLFSDEEIRTKIANVIIEGNKKFFNFISKAEGFNINNHQMPIWNLCSKNWLIENKYIDMFTTDEQIEDYLELVAKTLKEKYNIMVGGITAKYGIKITATIHTKPEEMENLTDALGKSIKNISFERKVANEY